MDTLKHTAIFVRNFFANYNNLKLIGLCGLFLVSIGSSKITAQQQAHNLSDNLSELSPSEKVIQILYKISKLTSVADHPTLNKDAFDKLNSDFPLIKALSISFDKAVVHAWLQTEPTYQDAVFTIFLTYRSDLNIKNETSGHVERKYVKQKSSNRSTTK
jgi:hypothetical protein